MEYTSTRSTVPDPAVDVEETLGALTDLVTQGKVRYSGSSSYSGGQMVELAIAFVVNHPGVTSAVIGPRTMEQLESQLPAADAVLDAATLDRIDEIAKPGVSLHSADTSYGEHLLEPSQRRR